MKQIMQSYRTGELWLADVPAPALRAGGAIVQTAASLVSAGTERAILELANKSLIGKAIARPDLVKKVIAKIKTEGVASAMGKAFERLDAPISLGYSCAGTVLELSEGMTGLKTGDRVACGGAGYASHAEANFVPKNLLARIPDNVSFEDASFTTLGAIAMQGVRQADPRLGERVAVVGLGLVGLLTVQLLQAAGCSVMGLDVDPTRCELAKQLGATASDSELFDAVIITAATSSNQPIEQAAELCRVRGRVVVVGNVRMDLPREPYYRKELDLRLSMSTGPGRYDPNYEEAGHDYPIGHVRWTEQRNMAAFLDLIATGKVTPSKLVTHRFAIDQALDAYALLERNEPSLGIVIEYPIRPVQLDISRTIQIRPAQSSERIGVGFIGAGNFARGVLIPTLKQISGIEFQGVCTTTGMTAFQTAKKHGFAYATTDPGELFGDPRINTIFIATDHESHAQFVCSALAAGKHVFVEKPFCVNAEQLVECESAIKSSPGQILTVGFNRRFSPHTAAISEAFASRTSPMLITYRINSPSSQLAGEICHFIDWCEFITGSEPVSVQADSVRDSDSAAITIRYRDDSLATIQYVTLGPADMGKERIEVFSNSRSAVLDDFMRTTFHGMKRSPLKTSQDKGFAGEMQAFLAAIRAGGPLPIPLESIFRTTRLTFAIMDCLRTGNSSPTSGLKLAA